MKEARIDKYLWCVRLFKTRTQATEACRKGQVIISDSPVKSSRMVKVGDVIQLKRPPVTYTFKILDIPTGRLGAKLVENYLQNITTKENIELLEMIRIDRVNQRSKGLGRPTKKERRSLESFLDSQPYFIDDDID